MLACGVKCNVQNLIIVSPVKNGNSCKTCSLFSPYPISPESGNSFALAASIPELAGLVHGTRRNQRTVVVEQCVGYLCSVANQCRDSSVWVWMGASVCGWVWVCMCVGGCGTCHHHVYISLMRGWDGADVSHSLSCGGIPNVDSVVKGASENLVPSCTEVDADHFCRVALCVSTTQRILPTHLLPSPSLSLPPSLPLSPFSP